MQAPIALPRCFAEILCPDFGFGSLREFRPRCRSFTVIHQVLPQNCASSVRKIYSQITLVQLCGIALNFFSFFTAYDLKYTISEDKKKERFTTNRPLIFHGFCTWLHAANRILMMLLPLRRPSAPCILRLPRCRTRPSGRC